MTVLSERQQVIELVGQAITTGARQDRAFGAISLSERTLQRWQRDQARDDQRPTRVQVPGNRLSRLEHQALLAAANSAEFEHLSLSQIVPRLADHGQYIASESTFYRVLKAQCQLQHRGAERPKQRRIAKPRALSATAPKQLFSWNITYLPSRVIGVYFYLYLFLDIFSRKFVGWQAYETEISALASEVMRDICEPEHIALAQVLHPDNGSPMKGATMLATLQSLGVMPSFSRPAVSNDNPYSESLFKTLKYRADYPRRAFENLFAARQWVGIFVHWYNHEHRHSALRFVTRAPCRPGHRITVKARVRVWSGKSKAPSALEWSHAQLAAGAGSSPQS
jgi:putative transposase